MQLKSLLSRSGLDRHQVEVYLSLISVGEGTAGQIAKKSGVPRTYTYRVLDELIDKGFVTSQDHRSIRRYKITDYEAPKRYIEKKQFELYSLQQEAQSLNARLENLANPQVATAETEALKEQSGYDDLWQLMHSTITREIWVINPPDWWGDISHSPQMKKWEQYRHKQHIWENRFLGAEGERYEAKYTEYRKWKELYSDSSIFLIDQYQVQITSWNPFRALRIESQEIVDLQKSMLEQ